MLISSKLLLLAPLSPPKYRNSALEKKIAANKGESELNLRYESLTDQDMQIVANLLVKTTVRQHSLFTFLCGSLELRWALGLQVGGA